MMLSITSLVSLELMLPTLAAMWPVVVTAAVDVSYTFPLSPRSEGLGTMPHAAD